MEAGNLSISVREVVRTGIALVGMGTAIIGGVWMTATWKTDQEEHLKRIDDHLHNEDDHIQDVDKKLQWLIDNHPNVQHMDLKGKPRLAAPTLSRLQPYANLDGPSGAP